MQPTPNNALTAPAWVMDGRTRVKICGITNLQDALHSVAAGADMLGFNFYPRSPRYLKPEAAREIIAQLPPSILAVGVFVNEPSPDAVSKLAQLADIGAVQLHGEESPDYCAAITASPVIKAFRVRPGFDPAIMRDYRTVVAILLDAYSRDEHGGTGHVFDWNIAQALSLETERLFLAGGLGVDNVAEAVQRVRPFAVDACSRLESRPGVKDHDQVAKFINAVNRSNKN